METDETYKEYKESFLIENIQIKEIKPEEENEIQKEKDPSSAAPSVGVINLAGNLGKGLIQATSSVVQTVHTAAKTSVKTGMEGVLGPSEESLKEMEKQAEIERLKR